MTTLKIKFDHSHLRPDEALCRASEVAVGKFYRNDPVFCRTTPAVLSNLVLGFARMYPEFTYDDGKVYLHVSSAIGMLFVYADPECPAGKAFIKCSDELEIEVEMYE